MLRQESSTQIRESLQNFFFLWQKDWLMIHIHPWILERFSELCKRLLKGLFFFYCQLLKGCVCIQKVSVNLIMRKMFQCTEKPCWKELAAEHKRICCWAQNQVLKGMIDCSAYTRMFLQNKSVCDPIIMIWSIVWLLQHANRQSIKMGVGKSPSGSANIPHGF